MGRGKRWRGRRDASVVAAAEENTCGRGRNVDVSQQQNVEERMREDHAHAVFVLHELRVSAALNELSTLQYADAVAADDGAKTVCDHDGGGTIFNFQQLINAPLHTYFTFAVESAVCGVKQHDVGPPD